MVLPSPASEAPGVPGLVAWFPYPQISHTVSSSLGVSHEDAARWIWGPLHDPALAIIA